MAGMVSSIPPKVFPFRIAEPTRHSSNALHIYARISCSFHRVVHAQEIVVREGQSWPSAALTAKGVQSVTVVPRDITPARAAQADSQSVG